MMHNAEPDAGAAQVSVIGLGLMGQALARTLLDAGHPTTVWNRTEAKAADAVARGAALAASPRDAVAASPLVLVCVSDYAAVHALIDPLADALEGRVLVNLSTGTAQEARDTAAWAARRGLTYLDGVVLVDPPAIGTEDAVLLYSGPRAAFDAHEPTLRALGAGTAYLGADHGLSALYDMAVLTAMWSVLNAFLHGAALLETAGVDAATLAPVVVQGVRTIADWVPGYAEQIDAGAYPATDATLHTHVAAMGHLVHESEASGIDAELPRLMKRLADRAVAQGHGDRSYATMIEQFRARAA